MNEAEGFDREVEEDHDLLTCNESSARLREEIAKLQTQIEEAGSQAATPDGQTLEAAKLRPAALHEAAERNSRLAETDKGAAGSLGFTPGKSTTD